LDTLGPWVSPTAIHVQLLRSFLGRLLIHDFQILYDFAIIKRIISDTKKGTGQKTNTLIIFSTL